MNGTSDALEVRTDVVRLTIRSVANRPGMAAGIFTDLGRLGFLVNSVAQTGSGDDNCDITLTLTANQSALAIEHIDSHLADYGASSVVVDPDVALLVIHDAPGARNPAFIGRVFESLARAHVNVEAVSAGPETIACLVTRGDAARAADAIRSAIEPQR
jgi:aspartate kinase